MNPPVVGIIGFSVFLFLLFMGMPVGFAMIIVGYAGFAFLVSPGAAGNILFADVFGTFNSYDYSVIPLFIFLGMIISYSGASRRIYDTAHKWSGNLPGGLAMATIGASAIFSAVSGSATAAVATIGTVAMPEMKKYKYDLGFSAGCIVAGGNLDPLIPPSIALAVYAILTEQSIIELLYAGLLPGLLLGALFMVHIYLIARCYPHMAPPSPPASFRERIKALPGVLDMFFLFTFVMVGLFVGWFTATEGAAIGAGAALLIGFAKGELTKKNFLKCVLESVKMTAMLFIILAGAFIFNRFLAVSKIPLLLTEWVGGLALPPMLIMTVIMIIFLIGGCIVEVMALMVLTLPVFFPVIVKLGYSPILFGIIVVIMMGMGAITPPVGIGVYIMKGIDPEIPIETIFKGAIPFLIPTAICIIMLFLFPQIVLFLPGLLKG